MKAALRKNYCTPQLIQVEEVAAPTCKKNEVLIRVHATTVNRTDCANLTAKPFVMRFVLGFTKPRIATLGTDFAGEIVSVGSHVHNFQLGDRVMGFFDTGMASQAEMVAVPTDKVYKMPENIDFATAAASLEGAHYAFAFVQRVKIKPQHKILINGATGAIGSALLQLVRAHKNVHISATASPNNIEMVRSLGADKVYDFTQEDFSQTTDRFDFIFDAVGKSNFGICQPLLTKRGVYISSEWGPYFQNLYLPLFTQFTSKTVVFPIPYKPSESIPFIIERLAKGTYQPVIDKTYSLNSIAEAYEYVISGKKTGNVVIDFQ